MAELEVIKHTKKIITTWGDKQYGLRHKIGELLLEVFIIVFAISLSMWFHNLSEHSHQQADVKAFLLGLRQDLNKDIQEMRADQESYRQQKAAFSYIAGRRAGQQLSDDSLQNYQRWIFNTTFLNPNNGRFEGFKSSGRIGYIEDDTLQNDIMDLYQENIPLLLGGTAHYIANKNVFFGYLQRNHRRLSDSTTNLVEILSTEEAHNIADMLSMTEEIQQRYEATIEKMEKIVAAIDKKYGR